MMSRGQFVALVCLFVGVQSASNSGREQTIGNNGAKVAKTVYGLCPDGYEDLRWSRYKDFDEYGTATRHNSRLPDQREIQCQNSMYCNLYSSKVRRVNCYNKSPGMPNITWDCDAEFYGSQYELANSTINCESYNFQKTCVLKNSCIFYYVPRERTSMVFILSAFGVFVGLGLIIFGVCFCIRRRNTWAAGGTTTTTIIRTSPNASVSSQAYAAPHAYAPAPQAYAAAPCYPGQQDYPPPYAAPYPQHPPPYGPPEPPKQTYY